MPQPIYYDLAEHHIALVTTPKCATTTLLNALSPLLPQERLSLDDPHLRWDANAVSAGHIRSIKPKRFIIGLVRNPWHRVVSHYKDKVIIDFSGRLGQFGFEKGMPFEKYIDVLEAQFDQISDVHVRLQSEILVRRGLLLPDLIIRQERFNLDFPILQAAIESRTGRPLAAPKQMNLRNTSHIKNILYTNRSRKIIRELYSRDIEMFGYHFPNELLLSGT